MAWRRRQHPTFSSTLQWGWVRLADGLPKAFEHHFQAWPIIEKVFRAGETYAFSPEITEHEAHNAWIETPQETYVATTGDGEILGTYFIKPNQPGLGSHVCNCGYIVSEGARGKGVASKMCEHSQQIAVRLGFRAMQYNLVVATNAGAIRLWQSHGFQIIGKLPGPKRDLDVFAALSHQTNFAIGCYCRDESRCHRSILKELLEQRGAKIK